MPDTRRIWARWCQLEGSASGGLRPLVTHNAGDGTYLVLPKISRLGPWLPSPPEDEVGDWCAPERVDDHHYRGPYPLRAPDLAGWPALDVDERRRFEDAFGNSCRHDQSTAARAEIAPLSCGHDTLRVRVWAPSHCRDPERPALYIGQAAALITGP